MKKILYSLSLVLAGTIAASAAAPNLSVQRLNNVNPANQTLENATVVPFTMKAKPTVKKNVKRNAATAQDFVGEYNWAGRNWLSGQAAPNEGTMTISIDENDPTKLIVDGLAYGTLYGTEPLSNCYVQDGKLYIPNQFVFENTYYNQEVWFYNYSPANRYVSAEESEDGEAFWGYSPVINRDKTFFFQFDDEGYLIAGEPVDAELWNNHGYTDEWLYDNICVGALVMPEDLSGYFWLCRFIEAAPIREFTFNEAEWQKIDGNALFKDAWFPNLWENGETPAYEVPLYRSIEDENIFLLYDPYGEGTPYREEFEEDGQIYVINESTKPGYIIFNVTDEECVLVQPLVYSLSIDMDGATPSATYVFNNEGWAYYMLAATTEDIIVNFLNEDMNVSFFDPNDAEGPYVQIYNGLFSLNLPEAGYTWLDPLSWSNYELEGWILLPNDYNSVESVNVDNSNAAPVYYNLQGLRVNNPEKGQLLIVKKGDKTYKQIIR